MMPWFIWKGKNSLSEYGLWINKLPKRVKAEERHEEIEIPGRAGSVLMLEGDDVYATYNDEIVVIARNELNIDEIIDWLRGSGELVLSTDPEKAYSARIVGEVSFQRVGNNLQQATIPFVFQPFRKKRNAADNLFALSTASGSIYNPGDVASKPIVRITGSGSNTITIAGNAMTFTNLSGTVVVDCEAEIITKNGQIWTQSVTGEFWKLQKGANAITQTGSAMIEIEPRWRWL